MSFHNSPGTSFHTSPGYVFYTSPSKPILIFPWDQDLSKIRKTLSIETTN